MVLRPVTWIQKEFVKPAVTQSKGPPAAHEDDFGRVLGSASSGSREISVDSDMRTSDDAGEMRKVRKAVAPLKLRTGIPNLFGLASLYLLSELTDVRLRPAV
jgi:hypothetical protein